MTQFWILVSGPLTAQQLIAARKARDERELNNLWAEDGAYIAVGPITKGDRDYMFWLLNNPTILEVQNELS